MRERISLNGTWRMTFVEPGLGDDKRLFVEPLAVEGWMDTPVPGDVHATLHKNGLIPDPYVGDNLEQCRWTQEKDFWFYREVPVPADFWEQEHLELVFHGIDTVADVFWNDHYLGKTDNMFREYRFNITGLQAVRGENQLSVKIRALDEERKPYRGQREYRAIKDLTRVFFRKPQCQFGWDWSPEFGSIGIWKGVTLESWSGSRIESVQVETRTGGEVKILAELHGRLKGAVEFSVEGHGETLRYETEIDGTHTFACLKLQNPRLWWPNGLGKQPLYKARVIIRKGDQILDEREIRFGVREIREAEERIGDGEVRWGITVNGLPMFCKGANWVPPDIFPGSIPEDRVSSLLSRAQEAGFNMLRLWGGGIYESDFFYDRCDDLGILIWQDFMFANADYPLEREWFRKTVSAEVAHQVKRLRNHPSLAVWCGGNEKSSSFEIEHSIEKDFDLFGVQIPGLLNLLDRTRPYVISSPIAYTDIGNDRSSGNSHTSVWLWAYFDNVNVVPFRKWLNPAPAFKSEFFLMGAPRASTFRKMFGKDDIWPPDEKVWPFKYRGAPEWNLGRMVSFHLYQINTMRKFFEEEPKDLSDFIRKSTVIQMEEAREEFEHTRCFRGRSGGALFWMMNDTWPAAVWSMVDFYGNPKPVFYAFKRACAPVYCTVTFRGNDYAAFLCNDGLEKIEGTLSVTYQPVDGKPIFRREEKACAEPLSSVPVVSLKEEDLTRPDAYLHVRFAGKDGEFSESFYYPQLWKDLPLSDPKPKVRLLEISQAKNEWFARISVKTERFARCLYLDIDPIPETVWSDNFFDLPAGEEKILEVCCPREFSEKDIRVGHWLADWGEEK